MTTDTFETQTASAQPLLSRVNFILMAVLLLQLALTAYVLWPTSSGGEAGVPLLGELETSDVTDLTIAEGEQTISFERADGQWVLAGTDGFPTTENKVSEVLEKLLAIDGNRLVTRTSNSHKRLQVSAEDAVRTVVITTDDGSQTLYVGSSAGSGATHVRLDGSDEAYLTNQVASFELNTNASNWVDTQYVNVTSDDVVAFTVENGNGTLTFARERSGDDGALSDWTLAELEEGEILEQSQVNSLLSRATSVRLTAPVGKSPDPAYGLDNSLANVTMVVEPGSEEGESESRTVTLQIGAAGEDGAYYAKSSESPYIVQISQFNGDQLIDQTKADLLIEPEEEAASDAGGENDETGSFFETPVLTDTTPIESVTEISPTLELTATSELTTTLEVTSLEGITTTEIVTE